jgi:putative transposase
MLEHKKFTIYDKEIIDDVKNGNIMSWSSVNKYKILIENTLKIKLKSDQNYIGRLVYATLGNNYGKLDSTMIGHIISKAHKSYNLYYTLLSKGKKAGQPKFLNKDATFTLTFFESKISKNYDPLTDTLKYNLFAGTYISKNLTRVLGSKYVKLANNRYIHKKYLRQINKKPEKIKKRKAPMKVTHKKQNENPDKNPDKITKKLNYIYYDKYIEKINKNIIDSKYITIEIPKIIQNKEIKTVEIVFQNNIPKICISYKIQECKLDKNTDPNKAISIDLGMGNLMSIYDPEGRARIITGKNISSLNRHLNKKISEAQIDKNYVKVNELNNKRTNKISSYFNEIVSWISKEYSNKNEIIIGYNKEWKKGCNMGSEVNRLFYGIPYCKLLSKLKNKLKDKEITLIEESYTSKCDSLGLEELHKKEEYMGKRIKRGLYSSSRGVLLNADINGAINIMRKKYKLEEIKGVKICNPLKVKI